MQIGPAVRVAALALAFLLPLQLSAGTAPDVEKILADIDALLNFDDTDFACVYTIASEKPGEEMSVTQARLFRRDAADQFVLLILKPEARRGQGYLRVEDTVWFYDPDSRQFERSSLRENVQDSDAQNSDFTRNSLSEDYAVTEWQEGALGSAGIPVWILTLRARSEDVSYETLKIWVRQDRSVVLKEESYSVSGRLMRSTYYPKYIQVGQRYLPSQALIVDELNVGEKTQLSLKDASVAAIPDYVFTKQYLELVNR
jgi:outer membrane lipoprotein-sorting protein